MSSGRDTEVGPDALARLVRRFYLLLREGGFGHFSALYLAGVFASSSVATAIKAAMESSADISIKKWLEKADLKEQ